MAKREMEEDLMKALETLQRGGIILYPTDTIWGLGCDATNEEAVERLFRLKGRPSSKAMISLVDSIGSLRNWVSNIPEVALREIMVSKRPLTIVYPEVNGISVNLIADDGSAAFRIPQNEFTAELCRRLGHPLVSTSANFAGEPSPSSYDRIPENLKVMVDYTCQTGRGSAEASPSRIIKIEADGSVSVIRE